MPLNDFFGPLKPNEREVLFHRFGLIDDEPLTQQQVAYLMGYTHQRVSQIEKRSLVKTRRHLEAHGLRLDDFV